jgi:hypothetical protein
MKKIEFEVFAFVFSLIPLVLFFSSFEATYIGYGLITIFVAFFLEGKTQKGLRNSFMFVPKELTYVVAILVFFPCIVTFLCFLVYEDISDAYWAFAMCCWAFGAASNGIYNARKET